MTRSPDQYSSKYSMRHLIDLIETLLQEGSAEFTGCYIEPGGQIHYCDHNANVHHADIAMDHFHMDDDDLWDMDDDDDDEEEDEEPQEDPRLAFGISQRKIDEANRDAALHAAMEAGWMQVSCIRDNDFNSFAVSWLDRATSQQTRILNQYIDSVAHHRFDSLCFEHAGDYEGFTDMADFLKALKRELRRG